MRKPLVAEMSSDGLAVMVCGIRLSPLEASMFARSLNKMIKQAAGVSPSASNGELRRALRAPFEKKKPAGFDDDGNYFDNHVDGRGF